MRLVATFLALIFLSGIVSAGDKEQVLVNFSGVLKQVTKKQIVIEPEPDNQMTFIRTKRTTFLSAGKPVDSTAIPQGVVVNVQAFEKLNREIEAVSVTMALPDQSPNK